MISVVIPSYNRRESVLTLLNDLYLQDRVDFEVIVVDDNSKDGTADAVEAAFPLARVLRNDTNRGPAVTRNRGIRAAQGNIIVGLDSDVTVPDRSLLRNVAITFDQLPDVDGLAFRLLASDGVSEDLGRWWHPLPITRYADTAFATYYFSGTGYAFRKDAVMAVGLFPEILFMDYEEVELALRFLDAGRTIMYSPQLKVVHHEHRVSRRHEVRGFFKPRNQVLIAVACLPYDRAVSYLIPRLTWHFLRSVTEMNVLVYFRALRDAVRHIPTRLQERRPLRPETFRRMAAMKRPRTIPLIKFPPAAASVSQVR